MRRRYSEDAPRGSVLAGVIGSTVVHAGIVAVVVLRLTAGYRPEAPVYAVQLVAAPDLPAPTKPTRVVEAPPPEPKVVPIPVKPTSKIVPAPPAKTPKQIETSTKKPPEAAPPLKPLPGETPGTGSDVMNLDLKGKNFPFPDYLRNIVNQVYRRWNRPLGSAALTAEVSFTILRDGSVRDIQVIKSSRVYRFDVEAQGAVEQAAADAAFGPLPPGWPADLLQVAVSFTPRSQP